MTQELTLDEIKIVTEQGNIFTCFFRDPTIENYHAIRENDYIYQKALGIKYDIFLWAVQQTFQDLETVIPKQVDQDYTAIVDKLLDRNSILSAKDLDILWMMYHATGDIQFPDRISDIAHSNIQNDIIRDVARWSYNSHINKGMIEVDES